MGHPAIDNRTPFAFEALYLVDEEFQPLVVALVKATFTVSANGRCLRAEEQMPMNLEGECWGEDPATSSYKYEPEVAFFKPATDVAVIGHAHAPRPGTTQMDVGIVLGSLRKAAVVFGDRVWFKAAGALAISRPVPFEKIPLVYERAFGGWDRSHPDESRHAVEPRNPVGVGFPRFADGDAPLPNVEDPRALLRNPGERPAPVGFGFISPQWEPRASLAGTYDDRWTKERAPLLPKNFDRRHLNAASPGLIAPNYLRGDEQITVMGMTPNGTMSFSLPGILPPKVRVARAAGPDAELEMRLDTVIVEPDERRVVLLWRAHARLRTGPHDVRAVDIAIEGMAP